MNSRHTPARSRRRSRFVAVPCPALDLFRHCESRYETLGFGGIIHGLIASPDLVKKNRLGLEQIAAQPRRKFDRQAP